MTEVKKYQEKIQIIDAHNDTITDELKIGVAQLRSEIQNDMKLSPDERDQLHNDLTNLSIDAEKDLVDDRITPRNNLSLFEGLPKSGRFFTFDDGPHEHTQTIAQDFEKHGEEVVFFFNRKNGTRLKNMNNESYIQECVDILKTGAKIHLHTCYHEKLSSLPQEIAGINITVEKSIQ